MQTTINSQLEFAGIFFPYLNFQKGNLKMQRCGKIKEASAYAGVSVNSIRKWLNQGLTSYCLGGMVLIKFTDIDAFIEHSAIMLNDQDKHELNGILEDMGIT